MLSPIDLLLLLTRITIADEERALDRIFEAPVILKTCASKQPVPHHSISRAVPLYKVGSDMLCHDESVSQIPSVSAPISHREIKNHIDDPVSKLLPAALKKYNITEDWRNYAMFICHGQTGTQCYFTIK